MLRYKTETRTWFSRFVRHPARKRSGSILTTPEPARGLFPDKNTAYRRCRPNNSPNYHLVTEVLDCNAW